MKGLIGVRCGLGGAPCGAERGLSGLSRVGIVALSEDDPRRVSGGKKC